MPYTADLPVPGQYRLRNVACGYFLDILEANPTGLISVWDENYMWIQKWNLVSTSKGYAIRNVSTSTYLAATEEGKQVRGSRTEASWEIKPAGKDPASGKPAFQILNSAGLAVELCGVFIQPGGRVKLGKSTTYDNQKWVFEDPNFPAKEPAPKPSLVLPASSGIYRITNGASKTLLDLDSTDLTRGAIGNPKHDVDSQKWYVQAKTNTYTLKNVASGLYLIAPDLKRQGSVTGGSTGAEWQFAPKSDGTLQLIATGSTYSCDMSSGLAAPGTKVMLWDANDTANQRWLLEEVQVV